MELTCPKCQGQMRQYERSGVLVDQCAECRGIFLDRGELEKLVNAETSWHGSAPRPEPQPAGHRSDPRYQDHRYDDRRYEERRYDDRRYDQHGRPKKKRSFLEDLFD
jgi:uncharacterized protein